MTVVHEPARKVPVAHACDVCVVGGSCTGVFAAIRAARLGASVVIVEVCGFFWWHAATDFMSDSYVDKRVESRS
jgi:flavin-dependent dehydrogenase